MKVFQTDAEGFFVGVCIADADPLVSGNWLIPAGCVTTPPPEVVGGQRARWSDGWSVVEPDLEPEQPAQPEPTYEELLAMAEAMRAAAYNAEADPLFFKWQRGEATEQEWLDKIAEIKARYPDPEVQQ